VPARLHDGQQRFAPDEIPGGALLVTLGSGRVELGRAAGQQVRVRWTVPSGRWGRGGSGPEMAAGDADLRIEARRARLRIDVPDVVNVTVHLGRGEITSWGAGAALDLDCPRGRVVCRELRSTTLRADGRYVNLHFATAPEQLDVRARESVIALPAGPYAISAPDGAEVEVTDVPTAARRITVSGGPTRILASQAPLSLRDDADLSLRDDADLSLRDEAPEGSADGG
jgi:hypothetical protein